MDIFVLYHLVRTQSLLTAVLAHVVLVLQGHTQQEHETSHGSMTHSRWAVYGSDETAIELGGRKFSSEDDGAPMMCNLVCSSMGRHIHIDYCRAEDYAPCEGPEVQHINTRMTPNPRRTKDAVTHGLYWRRMGKLHPIFRFSFLTRTSFTGFKGHNISITFRIDTNTFNQTHTLVMNRQASRSGAPNIFLAK